MVSSEILVRLFASISYRTDHTDNMVIPSWNIKVLNASGFISESAILGICNYSDFTVKKFKTCLI
jgi:hypothetical protein